jgi:DNA repair protein RecO (recombination protein O)
LSSEKSEAIVLRAVPWSETSLVVTLWTKDFGKVSAIAKGARRIRSPFESALDLLAHSSVVFIVKSGDVLDLLTEAKLIRRFRSGQQQLLNLYAGFYVAELLLRLTEENFAIPELFCYARNTLESLDTRDDVGELVLRFELHMLRLLGHAPLLDACAGCGDVLSTSDNRRPSSRTISFGIEAGGLLCDRCLAGQRSIIRIRESTRRQLLDVLSSSFYDQESLVPIPADCKREIRTVITRFVCSLLNRSFDLHPFLEDLAL